MFTVSELQGLKVGKNRILWAISTFGSRFGLLNRTKGMFHPGWAISARLIMGEGESTDKWMDRQTNAVLSKQDLAVVRRDQNRKEISQKLQSILQWALTFQNCWQENQTVGPFDFWVFVDYETCTQRKNHTSFTLKRERRRTYVLELYTKGKNLPDLCSAFANPFCTSGLKSDHRHAFLRCLPSPDAGCQTGPSPKVVSSAWTQFLHLQCSDKFYFPE